MLELFKLGLLQVALTPNPFLAGPYFNQTLDVSTASVLVHAGGTAFADHAVALRVSVLDGVPVAVEEAVTVAEDV